MVFILKIGVQVMTYMLQGSFLNSSFYTVRAHPEHLLYEADRAAALWVLVMNTNERVAETEHSCSLCSSERWQEVTVYVSKWPKHPFKSPEGQEGRTAGVWHTTTPVPVWNVKPEATRSRLRRNLFYRKLFCPVPSHQPAVEVFSVSLRVWMSHSGYWQSSDLLGSFPRAWGFYVGSKL